MARFGRKDIWRPARMTAAAGLMLVFLVVALGSAAPAEIQFGLAAHRSDPRGEFRDVLGQRVWGGSLFLGFRPSRSPVLIGTSVCYGVYDTDRWEATLGLTRPDLPVDVRTTNAIVTWDLFLRFQPARGFLRPYLDLFAGLNILTTDTRVGEEDRRDRSDDLDINNSSDTAFAAGAGAGLQFPLLGFVRRDWRRAFSIEADLGVRYALGGRADYLIETGEPGIFDARSSRTDMLRFSAGLTFVF